MTPRELPKYEVLFSLKRASDLSFSSFFLILTWLAGVRAFLAGRAHPIRKSFPKPLPVQLLKDRDKLSR